MSQPLLAVHFGGEGHYTNLISQIGRQYLRLNYREAARPASLNSLNHLERSFTYFIISIMVEEMVLRRGLDHLAYYVETERTLSC
jgi:hypothetical protein